jgi:hypothetical protein
LATASIWPQIPLALKGCILDREASVLTICLLSRIARTIGLAAIILSLTSPRAVAADVVRTADMIRSSAGVIRKQSSHTLIITKRRLTENPRLPNG